MTTSPIIRENTLQHDIHRPKYHFVPAQNWMNDPNGVIQWKGRYHLFYQYNPHGANHANMHWGHAVSDDLITWEELSIALSPTANEYNCGGIFSGCIVDDNGTPRAFYTGVNKDNSVQTQCLATGTDDLVEWTHDKNNPIITDLPEEMGQAEDFRDPFVWEGDDGWYMVVGSRIEGVGGTILLYRSNDLINWTYLNPLFTGKNALTGFMFECPNFFQLGNKWVLIISSHIGHTTGTVLYWVGDFIDNKFIPEVEDVLDSGYSYASLTHLDDQGRRLMWSWVREGRDEQSFVEAGWSGVQAFPRVLTLDNQNRLCMKPVEELATLRQTSHHYTPDALENPIQIRDLHLEVQASFKVGDETSYGLDILATSTGTEKITVYFDRLTETIRINRTYDESNNRNDIYVQGLPHTLDDNETLDLHILLDGSTIEVIANERTSITSRFYPEQVNDPKIHVMNPSSIVSLDIWEMQSIW